MPGLPTKPNNIPLASSLPKVSFRRIPAQEAIALAAPAGVVDQQNVDFGFNDGSPFERPEHYLRYVEPIETELKHQVEYDMDEQDQEWLDALNADRKRDQLDAVSNEVFEIIIDQLEKEWFDLMKQVPTKPPHGAQDDPGADDDDGEDTKCAICDDGEGENSNAIVFCDGCNLAVHQDCYGIPYVPEGQWLCRKCTVSPDRAVSCILCPHEGGAFKQTTQGKWAHLLCAMWIPETGVSNPVYMEPIDSVEKIPKARWRLQCYLCRCKMGACIQCDNKVCYAAFHVTCATKAGLLIQTERKRTSHHGGGGGGNGGGGDSGDDDSDSDAAPILRARCHKHVPPKLRSQLKISFDRANAISAYDDDLDGPAVRGSPFGHSSQRTREQSLDSSSAAPLIPVSRSGSVLADHDGQGSKSARAYKRSYRAGPPLVPAYIVNRVLDYIGRIALRKKPPLVAQIARFWSLKREARRGAPLLKRLHLEPWTASSHTKEQTDAQKVKKLAFLNTLRNDLEAVRMLAELVRKREREKLRQARLLRDALVNATLFPYYDVLASALAKVEALDRAHFFAAPVSRTEVPDYYDIIREPMDWSTMRDRLHEKAYASVQQFRDDVGRVLANAMTYNKADTPFHKAASRIQRQLPHAFRDLEHIEQLHQASFQAACRKLRPKRGDPADADRDVVLDDDTRDALQQLRLEPPIDHVMLLRDYAGMASRELHEAEATDATMTAAATPKASRARASRSAVATQRSSRATRARPARKTTEDKVDSGDEHDQGKRPSDAVAASGAHEDEGAGGKPKRPKRGHIPGEPEEIVTEEVDAIDSFLRFNTGWILKEGAKRNRGPRTPTSSSSAAVAEEPPLKRPRKASAPSANTSQASAASAAGTAAATASPQRPRAKTHPTRLAGASARLLDSGDGRKKADPDEAPVESEQTGATEGEVEATVGEDDVASTEATEATAADAADAGPTNGKPSDEERPRATPSRTPLGDADGEATTADTSGRSSPLSSEGEDEGDEAASPSPDKATGRALRSAPQQCHAVDGPVHSSTEAEGAAATADDAADLGDGDDDDEEGGVTPRRALKSRKSRVKAPPSSAPRKSARKPRRRSAAADDGDGAMPNEDPLCVPHTLVWAKMEGFPYFPAEVVDEDDEDQEIPDRVLEEKARQEALLLGPSAAASVSSSSSSSSKAASPADAASGSSAMRRQASSTSSSSVSASATATKAGSPDDAAEAASAGNNGQGGATAAASETKLVLVQFFGAKVREYVWLPTTKLRMMFEDAGVDDELLAVKEKKYAKHRRKVREAFQLAKAQLDA
ncbi:uncharacterized protein PFL1_02106 [Pseudozyma flocculosa PF-1]|uniref:uncharacterized protein n=1 Tax=Pseudozyma flocculosa PF-1 TaxID=1277687 RepID=UPI0004560310|nr:uncharacterized protein PFL1_02106 [Pseudozyma flocculosa PF-1]EPQ30582.1 hypothetical protein PFL1_02106 [Pseudozyma flocculosa PF-1]